MRGQGPKINVGCNEGLSPFRRDVMSLAALLLKSFPRLAAVPSNGQNSFPNNNNSLSRCEMGTPPPSPSLFWPDSLMQLLQLSSSGKQTQAEAAQ